MPLRGTLERLGDQRERPQRIAPRNARSATTTVTCSRSILSIALIICLAWLQNPYQGLAAPWRGRRGFVSNRLRRFAGPWDEFMFQYSVRLNRLDVK
jgi:hypothetical protein